eukprot:991744-Pelagomonas_calceolata.AAC.5
MQVLVDAFKSKLVEIDPPEPQQMVESSSSALQPTLASSKKYSQSSVVVPLGPLFSKGRDRSDVLDEMGSGQRARPPSSLTKKQAQRVEEQQPLPAAKDTGTSGVDWAAKYRQAMERQQRAIEILQGVGASEDALVAWPPSAGGKKVCGHCGRPWKGTIYIGGLYRSAAKLPTLSLFYGIASPDKWTKCNMLLKHLNEVFPVPGDPGLH